MKLLLVLVVVLVGFWVWRSNRAADRAARKPPSARRAPDPAGAIEMVRCEVCGVHCPKSDSVAGRLGVYCTPQHRSQAEPRAE